MGEIAVREPSRDDSRALADFLRDLPEGERRFLKREAIDADALLDQWLRNDRERHIIAAEGEHIAGIAAALPGIGWSSHVAEVEVLVGRSHRRRGLGRQLARRALVSALEQGCTHVYVEVLAEQEALTAMFQELGFRPEALLRDFVRDSAGTLHDLLMLTHRVDDHSPLVEAMGAGA